MNQRRLIPLLTISISLFNFSLCFFLCPFVCLKDEHEDGYSPQVTVEFKVSVEKKPEDTTDAIYSLMHSLKQTAHLCNLECFENVSYTITVSTPFNNLEISDDQNPTNGCIHAVVNCFSRQLNEQSRV